MDLSWLPAPKTEVGLCGMHKRSEVRTVAAQRVALINEADYHKNIDFEKHFWTLQEVLRLVLPEILDTSDLHHTLPCHTTLKLCPIPQVRVHLYVCTGIGVCSSLVDCGMMC